MSDGRRLRADAEANRGRIIAAAREVFAEVGPNPSFDSIAVRAGVGNATLYRHFPGLDELRRLVYTQRLAESSERFLSLEADGDSWDALSSLVRWVAEYADVALLERVFTGGLDDPELERQATQLREKSEALVARAKSDGKLAPDATPDDLRLAMFALGGLVAKGSGTAHARVRLADLVLNGLRAR